MPVSEPSSPDRAAALARQIALAAYWGLDDVPHRSAPEAPSPPDFLALPARQDLRFNLEPYSDVLGHWCSTPAGWLGLPVRLLRTVFKLAMGPWLDMQTLFNRAVLKTLLHEQESQRNYLEQVASHVRNERANLDEVQIRLYGCDQDVSALRQQQRLVLRHVVETLEQSGVPTPGGRAVPPQVLAQLFLQAWLPRPPARVFVACGTGGDDLGLTALGYHVVENATPVSTVGAAFDAVVCLAPGFEWDGLTAGLRAGGRAVIGARLDAVQLPSNLRLLEAAYALAGDRAWTYTSDAALVEALRARGPVNGMAYLAAEKH